MSRRDQDRRGGHDRDESRRHPAAAGRPRLNEYWIDGNGINRQVLQTEICKYLGAEATCRPGDYQGVAGFKIKALRPFTPDMLDDLRTASKAFMSENRAYMRRHDRELDYNNSRTYEQANNDAMDFSGPGRDSPAYTTASTSYAGPVSSAPGYATSSAAFSGASAFASHAGLSANGPATSMYSQDHNGYGHPPAGRDTRDPRESMMRDTPAFGNGYPEHTGGYHGSGPSYGDAYGAQRGGDPRGDTRMGYDNYGGGSYGGGPQRRQDPTHFDAMQGMSGPSAGGYGAPAPNRNAMPGYNDQGYDPYSRGAPVDPRYGRR